MNFPKEGITFKDITPILKDPVLSYDITDAIINELPSNVTHIAGIESRGFLFGFPVSIKNKTPFLLINHFLIQIFRI